MDTLGVKDQEWRKACVNIDFREEIKTTYDNILTGFKRLIDQPSSGKHGLKFSELNDGAVLSSFAGDVDIGFSWFVGGYQLEGQLVFRSLNGKTGEKEQIFIVRIPFSDNPYYLTQDGTASLDFFGINGSAPALMEIIWNAVYKKIQFDSSF